MSRLFAAVFVASALARGCPTDAAPAITLTSVQHVVDAVRQASFVTVVAYTISPNSSIVNALLADADRGAVVSVVVGGGAFGQAKENNFQTLVKLTNHGCKLDQGGGGPYKCRLRITQFPQHVKLVEADGEVYLSDRNWAGRTRAELVVHDHLPTDRAILDRAIDGAAGSNDHLWTRKIDAVAAEARMLSQRATNDVAIESESFTTGTAVYDALRRRAQIGDRVELLVSRLEYDSSADEQRVIADLKRYRNVQVRIGRTDEKMAVDGDLLYMGSANASAGLEDQIEWGMAFRDAELAKALAQQFRRNWQDAEPV